MILINQQGLFCHILKIEIVIVSEREEAQMKEKIEKLYTLYEQKMYRLAYGIVHNEAQAEDIVQESFIKIFSHIDKIEKAESVEMKRWILNIVKNEAIDYYRRNKRHLKLDNAMKLEQLEVKKDNVDDRLQEIIREEYIQLIFDELSVKDKKILRYRLIYELSTAETADMLGISQEAVRQRYARAKRRAKELIGGKSDE